MVTMKDIAEACGYSRITVSAVLNKRPGVSDRARAKILETVQKFNYRPNPIASSLVGKSSHLVGVIVRDLANPYFMKMFESAERELSKAGYTILYISTHEEHDREVEAIQTLLAYKVDGIILTPIQRKVNLDHFHILERVPLPVISVEKIPGISISYVDFKNRRGGYMATEFLINKGHRRIAFLSGPATSNASYQRLQGYSQCLRDHNVPEEEELIVPCGSRAEDGYDAASRLLKRSAEPPTAIFCFSDLVAIGVYQAAHAAELSIPDDISIMGFDDIDIAPVLGPPLTTVSFQIDRVGGYVARELIRNMTNRSKGEHLKKAFSPRIVERDSTSNARKLQIA